VTYLIPSDNVLTAIYLVLLLAGILLIIFWMQTVTAMSLSEFDDPTIIRYLRRAALVITAGSMAWAAHFCTITNWSPWLPDLFMVAGIDLYLAVAIVSARRRFHHPISTIPRKA
jgi:hypothetical protein